MTAPLPDAVGVVSLCERLKAGIWETWNDDLGEHELRSDPRVAADVIQSQAARIAELEAFAGVIYFGYNLNHTSKFCRDQARSLLSQPKDPK